MTGQASGILLLGAALAGATALLAHEGVEDAGVMARMHNMKDAQGALVVLGEMAKGTTAFDADAARAARDRLAEALSRTPALFETPHRDPLSEARPDIWDDWPDFLARAQSSEAAARALDPSDANALRAGFPALAQSCGACHERYRVRRADP